MTLKALALQEQLQQAMQGLVSLRPWQWWLHTHAVRRAEGALLVALLDVRDYLAGPCDSEDVSKLAPTVLAAGIVWWVLAIRSRG